MRSVALRKISWGFHRPYSTLLRSQSRVSKERRRLARRLKRVPQISADQAHPLLSKGDNALKDVDNFKINFLEEDGGPNPKRRRIDGNSPQVEDPELYKELEDTEKLFKDLEIDREVPESLAHLFVTEEQREDGARAIEAHLAQLVDTQAVRKASSGENGYVDIKQMFLLPWQIAATRTIPAQSQLLLDKLNEALGKAKLDLSDVAYRKSVLSWYSHCKSNITSFVDMIPNPGWRLLWDLVSQADVSNPHRERHRKRLAEDMEAAGVELSLEQRLAKIEGTFLFGEPSEAIMQWDLLDSGSAVRQPAYLELGIRMFSRQGDTVRAEIVKDQLFRLRPNHDPRVLMSIFHAYLQAKDPQRHAQAWSLYNELRDRLGDKMTLIDYDRVILALLKNKAEDHALAVFRDMMLSDNPKSHESLSLANNRIQQIITRAKNHETVQEASRSALSYLPRRFQNKYFYASWLKRLIGMGEIEAAEQVVQLMHARGIKPDAMHMNGMISAWLRLGNSSAKAKAESVAWSMIHARLVFVLLRDSKAYLSEEQASAISRAITSDSMPFDSVNQLDQTVPTATIETLSTLAQHYLISGRAEKVHALRDLLPETKLKMNSYFMNHVLSAVKNTATPQSVWSRFLVLSEHTVPDLETFILLWTCMKHHLSSVHDTEGNRGSMDGPRELQERMQIWLSSLSKVRRREAVGGLTDQAYDDIVRCFCLANDLPGTLIMQRYLKEEFGKYPRAITAKMLVFQIARLSSNPFRRKNSSTNQQKFKEQIAHISEVLESLAIRRQAELESRGVSLDALSTKQNHEEQHRLMMELVFASLCSMRGDLSLVQAELNKAAKDMHLEMFDLDEVLAPVV